jgi:hypothetical protein
MRVSKSSSMESGEIAPPVKVRAPVIHVMVLAKSAATSVRHVRAQAAAKPVRGRAATRWINKELFRICTRLYDGCLSLS